MMSAQSFMSILAWLTGAVVSFMSRNIPVVDDVADGRSIDRKMSSIDVPAADPLTDCKPVLVLAICDNDCVLRAFYGEDFFRNWHFQVFFYIVLLHI